MIHTLRSFYQSRFSQGSFGHNVLIMFVGTSLGQLSSVILAPALTRIYSPAMFGIFGLFTAALTILSVIASLRYEMALPLAQSDEEAANLLAVCIASLVATTGIGFLMMYMMPMCYANFDSMQLLMRYRWLLPIGFFCIGAYQVMVYYATWLSKFDTIAQTKVYQGVVGPLAQIGLGLFRAGTWGLVVGFILGQSTGVSLLFSRLVLVPKAFRRVSLEGMHNLATRFRRFPLVSSWAGLIEAAGGSYLLLVAVPLLYSNSIAGFVFLTDRLIGRPLLIISTSILQVYIGHMSKLINNDPEAIRQRFLQLAMYQSMIVAGWLLVVNLAAPHFFPIVFGEEWQGAVPYLQILSIAYLPQMVIHALVHTLQVLERQVMSALWEGGRFIAIIATFAASHTLGLNALQALLAYSIVQALAQVILFMLMYHSIQQLQKKKAYV